MDYQQLKKVYNIRLPILKEIADKLEIDLKKYLSDFSRIDKINTRVKDIDRFINKSKKIDNNGNIKYKDPLIEIQDQVGARIITYYLNDVEKIAKMINDYYSPIEEEMKQPKVYSEFSYVGKHFILFIPDELILPEYKGNYPLFFELQIKTLFQHAWAEAEHDINYKSRGDISFEDKRLVAFSAAQAWGADKVFNELFIKYNN